MNFGKAHAFMEDTADNDEGFRARVYRKNWNGKNMTISTQYPTEHSKMTEPYYFMDKTRLIEGQYRVPWVPSVADCFAKDWYLNLDDLRLFKRQNSTFVVSGFPGIGKKELFNSNIINCCDCDSSRFSKDEFPNNYVNHISGLISSGEYDMILVSSHEEIRRAMASHGIEYSLVYPQVCDKDTYIARYIERGSPAAFVKLMQERFEEFVYSCKKDTSAAIHHVLDKEYHLTKLILDSLYN